MIRHLHLHDVGPARDLALEFAPRLNILTGDNGLGKTFVLDVAWWTLTAAWAGEIAYPWRPSFPDDGPGSGYGIRRYQTGDQSYESAEGDGGILEPRISAILNPGKPQQNKDIQIDGTYEWENQTWNRITSNSTPIKNPTSASHEAQSAGIVIYIRIDGSFAVWDSYQHRSRHEANEAAIVMDSGELWGGKTAPGKGPGRPRTICRGLLNDWVSWQGTHSAEFEHLKRTLHLLSEPDEPLVPGYPTRVRLDDRTDIPTLALSYGDVPVTLASAGVRRILGISYILVWAWAEHKKAAQLMQRPPTQDMVVLIDEVELHLHPKWQRRLLPAILKAIGSIAPNLTIQIMATTHAPLVLASLESIFQEEIDNLHIFSINKNSIKSTLIPFSKQGDASNWLVSDAFGATEPRSLESELAIEAAMAFMRNDKKEANKKIDKLVELKIIEKSKKSLERRIDEALKITLPGHDEFWIQWVMTYADQS